MKLSEIGLLLLALAAITGLFSVVTGGQTVSASVDGSPVETDPLVLFERDIAAICCGSEFRSIPSVSADTIALSMDLLDTISIHKANLYITRTLQNHGYDHVVTFSDPDRGLSFLCHTPDGESLRFDLNDLDR